MRLVLSIVVGPIRTDVRPWPIAIVCIVLGISGCFAAPARGQDTLSLVPPIVGGTSDKAKLPFHFSDGGMAELLVEITSVPSGGIVVDDRGFVIPRSSVVSLDRLNTFVFDVTKAYPIGPAGEFSFKFLSDDGEARGGTVSLKLSWLSEEVTFEQTGCLQRSVQSTASDRFAFLANCSLNEILRARPFVSGISHSEISDYSDLVDLLNEFEMHDLAIEHLAMDEETEINGYPTHVLRARLRGLGQVAADQFAIGLSEAAEQTWQIATESLQSSGRYGQVREFGEAPETFAALINSEWAILAAENEDDIRAREFISSVAKFLTDNEQNFANAAWSSDLKEIYSNVIVSQYILGDSEQATKDFEKFISISSDDLLGALTYVWQENGSIRQSAVEYALTHSVESNQPTEFERIAGLLVRGTSNASKDYHRFGLESMELDLFEAMADEYSGRSDAESEYRRWFSRFVDKVPLDADRRLASFQSRIGQSLATGGHQSEALELAEQLSLNAEKQWGEVENIYVALAHTKALSGDLRGSIQNIRSIPSGNEYWADTSGLIRDLARLGERNMALLLVFSDVGGSPASIVNQYQKDKLVSYACGLNLAGAGDEAFEVLAYRLKGEFPTSFDDLMSLASALRPETC